MDYFKRKGLLFDGLPPLSKDASPSFGQVTLLKQPCSMAMMEPQLEEIKKWLMDFSLCVRNLDFETGRTMFFDDAYCFGSKADILKGVDDLVEYQWKKIWPNISEFQFLTDQLHCELNDEGNFACVMAPWISTGFLENGTPYHRPGRVTIILIHDKNTLSWLAKHTHYSLCPGTPTTTFSPPSTYECKSSF